MPLKVKSPHTWGGGWRGRGRCLMGQVTGGRCSWQGLSQGQGHLPPGRGPASNFLSRPRTPLPPIDRTPHPLLTFNLQGLNDGGRSAAFFRPAAFFCGRWNVVKQSNGYRLLPSLDHSGSVLGGGEYPSSGFDSVLEKRLPEPNILLLGPLRQVIFLDFCCPVTSLICFSDLEW